MSRGGTTLYVTGFSHGTRARDLAHEFERAFRDFRSSSPSLALPVHALAHLAFVLVLVLVHALPSSAALASAYQSNMPPSSSVPRRCVLSSFARVALSTRRPLSAPPWSGQPPVAVRTDYADTRSAPDGGLLVLDEQRKLQIRERDLIYGHLVRCDIPAPRSASSRLFAFVEYEDRRDADDAYHEMHNKRIGRDDILKIEWARTPPSASWRFDSGRDRERAPRRSSPRRGRSPSPRRSTRDYSPRKDDRRDRDRDYDRDRRDTRDRSRSPDRRDRDTKDDRDERDHRENGTNGDDRKAIDSPPPAHDDLDVAAE
ncbi:pre-mRNA splicing factor [Colletotrichum karsti]|uniref:Pre-mRNA splicing factor n=1 Tax=Colletotrichum karsti TaxID=1095194 RepID=A0A9P6LQN1_9PEZI|nr:pre-mRNA splicing factor [Colletotrichum karsti]KAF9882450.1 pre-mRNA splicing factor [Colletotrichum karsti]